VFVHVDIDETIARIDAEVNKATKRRGPVGRVP
jgi:hypothetical protein